jgi:DUF1365 family protein
MKIASTLLLACVCAGTLLHPRLCDAQAVQPREALEDTRLYFTAPLRWDGHDWIAFGSTLVAIGIVHEFDDDVRDLVREREGFRPAGPVRLLTHLRAFGHCFNPVSFYYCYDATGRQVESVVAEITNAKRRTHSHRLKPKVIPGVSEG